MNKPVVVLAVYKPKEGKEKETEALVRQHYSVLREYGLSTDRDNFLGKSADGSYVEIFEWVNESSAQKAHEHPAVGKLWEAMAKVCDFPPICDIPEAKKRFSHLKPAF